MAVAKCPFFAEKIPLFTNFHFFFSLSSRTLFSSLCRFVLFNSLCSLVHSAFYLHSIDFSLNVPCTQFNDHCDIFGLSSIPNCWRNFFFLVLFECWIVIMLLCWDRFCFSLLLDYSWDAHIHTRFG